MLRERYAPMNLLDLVPTLPLALDPVLVQRDHLLDDDTLPTWPTAARER
jgi:hypothetical protein